MKTKFFKAPALKAMCATMACLLCVSAGILPVKAIEPNTLANSPNHTYASESLAKAYSQSYSGFSVFDPQKYAGPEQTYPDYDKYTNIFNDDCPIVDQGKFSGFFKDYVPVLFSANYSGKLQGIDSTIKDSGDIQTYVGLIDTDLSSRSVRNNTITVWCDDSKVGFSIYNGNGDLIYKNADEFTHKKQNVSTGIISFQSKTTVAGKTAHYFEIDPKTISVKDFPSMNVFISMIPLNGAFESEKAESSDYAIWSGAATNLKYTVQPYMLTTSSIIYPNKEQVDTLYNRFLPQRAYYDKISASRTRESGDLQSAQRQPLQFSDDGGQFYKDLPASFSAYYPTEANQTIYFKTKLRWGRNVRSQVYMYSLLVSIDAVIPMGT